ncbi:MAG: phospholipid/cholesterol/gamma-HCH transport system substrate-binding protein [Solirubrobacteraceae bacterium]|jgi:phospholipid/cholesterol/gamma-HCH transport system substrate-binding protein|nr:phospholipid/cholesterol/gamma-HCH transport system substrate-binding protein [Solirubrobacteraceae bacterium]
MRIRLVPLLIILAAVAYGGYLLVKPSDDKYVVYADFNDAGGVLKNYNVKIGQITAGTIEKVELIKGDVVRVRMELDDSAAPIGTGASAKVRPVNLLGEKYIDLDPGDVNQPVKSGSTIPESRTGVPVELDDVLNTLDPDTRAGLRILINEFGTGLAGRGEDFSQTLEDLPPAIDQARRVVSEVAAENKNLETAIVSGDRVINQVFVHRDELGDLVDSAGDALATVADRRAALGATLRAAPQGFDRLRETLSRLQGASDQLAPAARDLQRTDPALATTLARLPAFANDASIALDAIRETSPTLQRLGDESVPTLRRLRPTAHRLASFATQLRPLANTLGPQGGFRALLGFIDGWTGVTSQADGLGHVFRLRLVLDDQILTSALQRYSQSLGLPQIVRKGKHGAKAPAQTGTAPQAATPPAANPVTDLTKSLTDKLSATTQSILGDVLSQPALKNTAALLNGQAKDKSDDAADLLNYLVGP